MANLILRRGCASEQRPRFRSNSKNTVVGLIPSSSLFESASKGFSSFQSVEPIASRDSRYRSEMRNVTSVTEPSTAEVDQVKDCLTYNRTNLNSIQRKISSRRRREYEEYIASGLNYNKLLELNNNRSKILTSLYNKNVGEVKVTQLTTEPPEVRYTVECELVHVKGWKPECREGQSCLLANDQIVLLGGHNNYPISRLSYFNIYSSEWTKGPDSDLKRTYHSATLYRQSYLILFGGMGTYNSHYKTRECLNSCVLYTATNNTLRTIKISNEEIVEPRRQHSACIIGKFMLVYGGVNTKKEYLSDLRVLDLKALQWHEREYRVDDLDLCEFLGSGLAKMAVFTHFKQRDSYPLYSKTYEPNEGMYLFGGSNQLGLDSGMLQFRFDKRISVLQRVFPKGMPPSSVYPVVHQYKPNLVLILSGQRGERSLNLYKILENEYVSVESSPLLSSIGGVGSSLINRGGSYYVLFGITHQGYMNNIIKFQLRQQLIERDRRKPQPATRTQATFFDDSSQSHIDLPIL